MWVPSTNGENTMGTLFSSIYLICLLIQPKLAGKIIVEAKIHKMKEDTDLSEKKKKIGVKYSCLQTVKCAAPRSTL